MMKDFIDCLFIGHNEMNFQEYEKRVREMGIHSGAYRDLNLNYIYLDNKPRSISEVYNMLCGSGGTPINLGENFSAAAAYLGTFLNKRGLTFDYINSFQDEKEELSQKLEKENILTIAIITTLYISVFPILEIMDYIKKYNRTAKVIIGGPFVASQVRSLTSDELEYMFKTIGADFFVNSSQGEAALVNIIGALKNRLPVAGINNIYYKSGETYTPTAFQRENNRLSENMVDWDLFSQRVGAFVNVRTSISCPFSCAFCGFPQHAGQYQTAPVDLIERELDKLARIDAVESINFIDDTFNVPAERFKQILRMMIRNREKKNYSFKWHSHFRCQFADRETVALMKESGCEGVFLGIESGSPRILKNMNKAVDIEKYRSGIGLLEKAGIITFGSFIIGFPGETGDTVKETVRFIEESGLDFYRAQLWYCDPMTPIWKEREIYGVENSRFEWSHATMDAKQASGIVEHLFLSVANSTWIPQYNFEFDGLFHLLHRGIAREQAEAFIKSFNKGVKEKLANPLQTDVRGEVLKALKKACREDMAGEIPLERGENLIHRYGSEFDFD